MRKLLKGVALAALMSSLTALPTRADDTDAYVTKAREILGTAVSIRTAKGHGNVPKLAAYLADQLMAAGFPEEDIYIKPVGETAALIVRYRGDGSSGKKPILISAHMDVVEANPEDWERDPFTMIEENGYFFGRGVSDNKFGMTMVTTTFIRLKQEGFVPNRDLILGFSGDEETGMVTTKALANDFRELTDAEYVLVADAGGGLIGEDDKPVSYGVQAAEKTFATWDMTVRNPGGHSSRPRADNAIYELADALKAVQAYQFPAQLSEITKTYFTKLGPLTGGALGDAMTRFANDPTDTEALATLRANPAYVGTTGTTCVATMLKGGHAENALPQSATATVNCRIFPGTGVENTLNMLKAAVGNDAVEWAILKEPTESPASPLRDDVMAAVDKAVHAERPGLPIIPNMSSGGTDGMHFRAAGMEAFGTSGLFMKSSDAFAHGLNERVPVAAVGPALRHWHSLLTTLAGN